jgi:anti-sigma B factor antagonist
MSALEAPLPEEFTVSVVPDRREVAVVPAGELDLSCADRLHDEVTALRAAGFDQILVDLRRVTFLDSSGLRILLTLHNDAKRNRYTLKLVPGPREVQRVFELTGTRGLFDWRDY